MKIFKLSLVFLLFAALNLTWADEITLQNGENEYDGCEDTYIGTNNWGTVSSMAPGSNFGSQSELKVHRESCWSYPIARAAIKFDLSDLPENAIIEEATMSLYVFAHGKKLHTGGSPNNAAKAVYRITESWNASNTNWNSKPSFSSTALDNNSNTSINTWEDFDVTSAIKDIIEDGGDDYGFLIKFPSESSYKGARIRSSEASTTSERPKLVISYDLMTDINQNISKITPNKIYTVTVTNVQGREISTFKTGNLNNLNRLLPSGVHIIQITTPEKRLIRKYSVFK